MPVASQHQKRRGEQQRRTLELLAAAGSDGLYESLLVHGHRIPVEVLVELIKNGRASMTVEELGRPRIKVVTVQITDAGRKEIGEIYRARRGIGGAQGGSS